VSFGGIVGLRYEGCTALLELYGLNTRSVWDGLRIIEAAYVTALRDAKE
jgi:hypothetical protein